MYINEPLSAHTSCNRKHCKVSEKMRKKLGQ